MNHLVGVHDFLHQIARLLVVHRPDLLDSLVIRFFKFLEALLQFDELVREQLVILGVRCVQISSIRLLHFEQFNLITQALLVLGKLGLEAFLLLLEDLLTFEKHVVVEAQLLLVQLVDSFHVLHALLEDLHLCLQLDFLLGLLVSVLPHHVFQVSRVLLPLLLSLGEVTIFGLCVLDEELLDLLFVAVKDGGALAVELSLDGLQLLVVVLAHLSELGFHPRDQQINIL